MRLQKDLLGVSLSVSLFPSLILLYVFRNHIWTYKRLLQVVFFEIFLLNEKGEVDDLDLSGMAHKDATLEKKMEEFGVTVAGFHVSIIWEVASVPVLLLWKFFFRIQQTV